MFQGNLFDHVEIYMHLHKSLVERSIPEVKCFRKKENIMTEQKAWDVLGELCLSPVFYELYERHLKRVKKFKQIGTNLYEFELMRYRPVLNASWIPGLPFPAYKLTASTYNLDTIKEDVTCVREEVIEVVVNYGFQAQIDAENMADGQSNDLRKITSRKKALEYIENSAESICWESSLEDEISSLMDEDKNFNFDWNRYLSEVKQIFKDRMIDIWDDSDHLKLVE